MCNIFITHCQGVLNKVQDIITFLLSRCHIFITFKSSTNHDNDKIARHGNRHFRTKRESKDRPSSSCCSKEHFPYTCYSTTRRGSRKK
nr:MAG TPA: hypothetical protein [Caudoviricetes sp.]